MFILTEIAQMRLISYSKPFSSIADKLCLILWLISVCPNSFCFLKWSNTESELQNEIHDYFNNMKFSVILNKYTHISLKMEVICLNILNLGNVMS